jgi:hypothetical protein
MFPGHGSIKLESVAGELFLWRMAYASLPRDFVVPPEVLVVEAEPFARGACGPVYKATLNGLVVCAKVTTRACC